jgi:hypothetical protein
MKQSSVETRKLLIGMGLKGKMASDYESEAARELLQTVLSMVEECRVW